MAELLPPVESLRKTIEDTLDSGHQADVMTARDPELDSIWQEFKQVLKVSAPAEPSDTHFLFRVT